MGMVWCAELIYHTQLPLLLTVWNRREGMLRYASSPVTSRNFVCSSQSSLLLPPQRPRPIHGTLCQPHFPLASPKLRSIKISMLRARAAAGRRPAGRQPGARQTALQGGQPAARAWSRHCQTRARARQPPPQPPRPQRPPRGLPRLHESSLWLSASGHLACENATGVLTEQHLM